MIVNVARHVDGTRLVVLDRVTEDELYDIFECFAEIDLSNDLLVYEEDEDK